MYFCAAMTFVSLAYALLLPLVFLIYQGPLRRSVVRQNALLLAASYIFYAWWDWRFLGLLLFTTISTWACALPAKRRKAWAALSVTLNLGVLIFFKYCGFFTENLRWLLASFGVEMDWFTIEILLPVGISFYTFQAIGYAVDVYRGDVDAERNPLTFALYISFFPQLVAGPIEAAGRMLPQFRSPRPFDYASAVEGLRRILWGLFKKVVVADGVALWVDKAFNQPIGGGIVDSVGLALGIWLFLIQIYADFSGYCDIARGSAQLLGFRLSDNFLFPLFSRNAGEMWRRWHRSLMAWFRNYVYIPLGGSRRGNRHLHVMAVFLLSGLWHGADWTFILWGLLGGLWLVVSGVCGAVDYRPGHSPAATRADSVKMLLTCFVMAVNFTFFRADSVTAACRMLACALPGLALTLSAGIAAALIWRSFRRGASFITAAAIGTAVTAFVLRPETAFTSLLFHLPWIAAAVMLVSEWRSRHHDFGLACISSSRLVRTTVYFVICFLVFTGASQSDASFIYFRF